MAAIKPVSEYQILRYLETSKYSDRDLLEFWGELRKKFILLCGDPPPKRWILPMSEWLFLEEESHKDLKPVWFKVIPPISQISRVEFPTTVLDFHFISRHPKDVKKDYALFLFKLISEMMADLQERRVE